MTDEAGNKTSTEAQFEAAKRCVATHFNAVLMCLGLAFPQAARKFSGQNIAAPEVFNAVCEDVGCAARIPTEKATFEQVFTACQDFVQYARDEVERSLLTQEQRLAGEGTKVLASNDDGEAKDDGDPPVLH